MSAPGSAPPASPPPAPHPPAPHGRTSLGPASLDPTPLGPAPAGDQENTGLASPPIHGLILAGGLARRMGGRDKARLELAGRPLLSYAIGALAPQVAGLMLSANGPADRFAPFGLPVLADPFPEHPGPLAGILAGLDHLAATTPAAHFMVSAPVDTPFLPEDLVARLMAARAQAGTAAACAESGGRSHPVVALWPVAARYPLRSALERGERRVGAVLAGLGAARACWKAAPHDPFANVNTPEDLERAAAILSALR